MKLKRPEQRYDLVEVIWDDAAGLKDGWYEKLEEIKHQIVLSVGFLLKETDDHIVIAMDLDADGQHNGRSQIPKGMLKHMKVIRKADKHKSISVVVPEVQLNNTLISH